MVAASAAFSALPAPASALWSGTCFIYIQYAVAEERAIQGSDGPLAIFRARHLHEAEPARLVRVPIPDDGHSVHPTVSCKQLADVLFTCIEVEVPTKMFFTGVTLN